MSTPKIWTISYGQSPQGPSLEWNENVKVIEYAEYEKLLESRNQPTLAPPRAQPTTTNIVLYDAFKQVVKFLNQHPLVQMDEDGRRIQRLCNAVMKTLK